MPETATSESVHIGKDLQKHPQITAKVRKLEPMLRETFGPDTHIEWDLNAREPEIELSIRIGTPGQGECTRWIVESLLDNTSWLENVFREMTEALATVRTWLREVEALFKQARSWLQQWQPSLQITEEEFKVREPFTGEYTAKIMLIRQRKKVVELRPRGTWWLTTEGRLDIVGQDQEYTLILARNEGGWFWVEEGSAVSLRPLTRDLFVRLIKDCME